MELDDHRELIKDLDDTWVRILEIIKANKKVTSKKDKLGMHTTGLISPV